MVLITVWKSPAAIVPHVAYVLDDLISCANGFGALHSTAPEATTNIETISCVTTN